ncbi:hypothetical protein Hanom_Chr02g00120961 [Helianthus anomalus]
MEFRESSPTQKKYVLTSFCYPTCPYCHSYKFKFKFIIQYKLGTIYMGRSGLCFISNESNGCKKAKKKIG